MSEPSQSSTFLTGLAASPTAAGLAAAGASYALGNRGKGNPSKKAWQYKLKYGLPYENLQHEQNEFWRNRQIQGRVKDARAAGLHPLAALGISTGGSINPASASPGQLEVPGQSDTGSAIGAGLKAASAMAIDKETMAHGKMMAKLQLEEQSLRNDWLRTQIDASANKRNETDALTRRPTQRIPHHSEGMRATFVHPDGTTYSGHGGTSAEDLEREINDWAQWMPTPMRRAWQIFKEQMRYETGTQDLPAKYRAWAKKHNVRFDNSKAKPRPVRPPADTSSYSISP